MFLRMENGDAMSDAISDGYNTGILYRWATVDGRHGTPTVTALEAHGWTKTRESTMYPGSWLMRKG